MEQSVNDRTTEFIDEPTLASELDVSEWTPIAWRRNGTGPDYIKVGRLIRYRRSDIDSWLAENTHSKCAKAASGGD